MKEYSTFQRKETFTKVCLHLIWRQKSTHTNNKNSLFIGTSANTSKKDHEPNELLDYFTDAESNRNEIQRTTDLEILTPIEKHQCDNTKENLPILAEKLDILQSFFLTEISHIKGEVKNKSLQKTKKRAVLTVMEKSNFYKNR